MNVAFGLRRQLLKVEKKLGAKQNKLQLNIISLRGTSAKLL